MVHHHRGGQRREEVIQLGQVLRLKVHHHMPAQGRNAVGNVQQDVLWREVGQAFDEVEAGAAHTSGMHLLQFSIRHVAVHGGHAFGFAVGGFQRVDQSAVIGAVAGGLHDHILVKAQVVT